MHSSCLRIAHICAFFISLTVALDARGDYFPPTIEKTFDPNPIAIGGTGTLSIHIHNPNASALDAVGVGDSFPKDAAACMALIKKAETYGTCTSGAQPSEVDQGGSPGTINMYWRDPFPAGADCTINFTVVATAAGACVNSISAYSYQAAGQEVQATWTINDAPVSVWVGPASGPWSTAANFNPPLAANNDAVFQGTGVPTINDTSGTQIDRMVFHSNAFAVTSAVTGANDIVLNAIVSDAGPGTVSLANPLAFPNGGYIQSNGTVFSITQGTSFNDHLTIFPAGGVIFGGSSGSAVISGSGVLGVAGGLLQLNTPPTFDGPISVWSDGTLYLGAPLINQNFELSEFGKASGPFATSGSITVSPNAILQPGSGTTPGAPLVASATTDAVLQPAATPATWSTGPLTINEGTEVLINFGTNNTQYSKITTGSALTINGGVLKLNFVTAPTLGVTYGAFISTTGTRTGCPTEVVVCNPQGIEAVPVCFLGSVDAKIVATDSIKRAAFDEFYESCP